MFYSVNLPSYTSQGKLENFLMGHPTLLCRLVHSRSEISFLNTKKNTVKGKIWKTFSNPMVPLVMPKDTPKGKNYPW